jgi:hypothetical protein
MKRLFALTLIVAAGFSAATAVAAEPERIRGTLSAVSADEVTVHTATGDISLSLGSDTAYLKALRSNLNQVATGSYIGVATKNVGDKLVALDVLVFPPSMKGAAQGHFPWDKVADTTLSSNVPTASTMTNGSVAEVKGESVASVDTTMTNGSVATTTEKGETKELTVTYKGGEQTIFLPPTAAIVTLQPGTVSDLRPGVGVFVNAIADGGKTTAKLIIIGSDGMAPPI